MNKYEFQILIFDPTTRKKTWKSVHPTNGKPYQYNTKGEAQRMLDMCYPDVFPEEKRVINVNKSKTQQI